MKKTTITKKRKISKDLIVNCVSEHCGRTIFNQTKILLADNNDLYFFANEPMSHTIVQIWDAESGALCYSRDTVLMMSLHLTASIGLTPRCIRDPWTEKLRFSASNREDIIEKDIEKVSPTAVEIQNTIRSDTYDIIDAAMNESIRLFRVYNRKKAMGAFIPNERKDGEINSFIKIHEYMEAHSVNRVVIADPFFSIEAVSKILTRISRKDVAIKVLTSLGKVDPDTGEKRDVFAEYREKLEGIRHLLHENLSIVNLKRGSEQVFHDRYLLRIFKDGSIDGFMLGNSINSMGQRYPFVITPLEWEVCLDVWDYFQEMTNEELQKKKAEKQRIDYEILFESKAHIQFSKKAKPEPLPLKRILEKWYNPNSILLVSEDDLSSVISVIWGCWEDNRQEACQALCGLRINAFKPNNTMPDAIRSISGLEEAFVEVFVELAKEKEPLHKHDKKGLDSDRFFLWTWLNDDAVPNKMGVRMLFEQAGHLCYSSDGWLRGGYDLLLVLNPSVFVELLDEIKSPLMFDILSLNMLNSPWSEEAFCTLMETTSLCVQILCAYYMICQFKKGKTSTAHVCDALTKIHHEKRAIVSAYLISQIAFYARMSKIDSSDVERYETTYKWLVDRIAEDLPRCSEKMQETAIDWIYDCEDYSSCCLNMEVALRMEDPYLKERLLRKVVTIANDSLRK